MYVTSNIQLAGMWLNMQLAQSISVLLSVASGFVHLCTQLVKKGKKMQIMSFFQKMTDI